MNISWYIKRAQVMHGREWIHRFHEQAALYWLRRSQKKRDKNPVQYNSLLFSFFQTTTPLLPSLDWDEKGNSAYAESLLAGCWPALGFNWRWQNSSDWHCGPDTGKHWPNDFFSGIASRANNPIGDIRIVWEPSRLQQLVSLSLLANTGVKRDQAVLLFERLLLSWVQANPPYRGVHYVSAMECALRLIAVCHSVDMIRPYLKFTEALASAVLSLVDSHASLIIQRLSLYSSSGNHTIAECAGLIYAGELFPEFPEATRWREQGMRLLEREVGRQFLPDGASVEQSFAYHLIITDLCHLVARLLAKKGRPSKVLAPVVESAINFLSVLFDDDWELPNVGDNDGGHALSPYLRISHKIEAKSKTENKSHVVRTFRLSGYSLIRNVEGENRLIVFDHGSLGMPPCYGHGHSDCLSVFWREKGEPLLIDPGSFTYNGEARWRSYFRGVTAHNTVSVDYQDQAVERSAFMWGRPFDGRLLDAPKKINGYHVLLASHSGYRRLGVIHYRALIYSTPGGLLVWDFLRGTSPDLSSHQLSQWWHLGGECQAESMGHCQVRGKSGACLQIQVEGGEVHYHRGDEQGQHGWYSPIYGKKYPITTLEARCNSQFPHEFKTYICPGSKMIGDDEKHDFDNVVFKLRSYIL